MINPGKKENDNLKALKSDQQQVGDSILEGRQHGWVRPMFINSFSPENSPSPGGAEHNWSRSHPVCGLRNQRTESGAARAAVHEGEKCWATEGRALKSAHKTPQILGRAWTARWDSRESWEKPQSGGWWKYSFSFCPRELQDSGHRVTAQTSALRGHPNSQHKAMSPLQCLPEKELLSSQPTPDTGPWPSLVTELTEKGLSCGAYLSLWDVYVSPTTLEHSFSRTW